MVKIKTLLELMGVFCKVGAVTFGGGLAMLPILERELCIKRNWVTSEELLDYFAIGQSTPGIIAVNVATFVGYNKCSLIGAVLATMSIVFPSLVVITIIAKFVSNFADIPQVQSALKGINIAVAALLTYSVVNFAKKTIHNILGVAIFLLAFVSIFFFHLSSVLVVLVSSVMGIALHLVKTLHNKKGA